MTRTIFKVKFGSHLYGTSTPQSDTDYKSVHIPCGRDIIMQSVQSVVSYSTGSQTEKNNKDDIDDESFAIGKFLSMLSDGDMIAYELLFVDESQALYWDPIWEDFIHNSRYSLIDRNIKGFIGYIRKQVNKYGVKGSRVATARDARNMFNIYREYRDYKRVSDIPYDALDEFVCLHEHCSLITLPINKSQPDVLVPFIEILNRKIDFRVSINEAYNIMNKVFEEYGARALAAEQNQGVDWKAVYHAVRVSEQALELVDTGKITFPRQNIDDLLKIRRGERSFADVATQLENNLIMLEDRVLTTQHLRDTIDQKYLDYVKETLYLDSVRTYYEN